jgi:hypothetical protein
MIIPIVVLIVAALAVPLKQFTFYIQSPLSNYATRDETKYYQEIIVEDYLVQEFKIFGEKPQWGRSHDGRSESVGRPKWGNDGRWYKFEATFHLEETDKDLCVFQIKNEADRRPNLQIIMTPDGNVYASTFGHPESNVNYGEIRELVALDKLNVDMKLTVWDDGFTSYVFIDDEEMSEHPHLVPDFGNYFKWGAYGPGSAVLRVIDAQQSVGTEPPQDFTAK